MHALQPQWETDAACRTTTYAAVSHAGTGWIVTISIMTGYNKPSFSPVLATCFFPVFFLSVVFFHVASYVKSLQFEFQMWELQYEFRVSVLQNEFRVSELNLNPNSNTITNPNRNLFCSSNTQNLFWTSDTVWMYTRWRHLSQLNCN